MRAEILNLASELAGRGEAFVLATVVRRKPPSSAQVGDTALVTATGAFHGWLGGSCTQPTVVREALAALAAGKPRLIALASNPEEEQRSDVTVLPMTCYSRGSVDIYIEPVLPASRLMIFGTSPGAQALARLGSVLGYTVEVVDSEADATLFPQAHRVRTSLDASELQRLKQEARPLFVVVASLGRGDEDAIRTALSLDPVYLGVVASRKRFEQVAETLKVEGVAPESLAAIKSPAGLDIGAQAPEEIALSILAEIVQVARARSAAAEPAKVPETLAEEARDPVCEMVVPIATARYHAEFAGRTYYFCCEMCRKRFLAEPERYLAASGEERKA